MIRCKKCKTVFDEDITEKKEPWTCPNCGKDNPNLRKIFRSVASVYVLWSIGTVAVAAKGIIQQGFSSGIIISAVQVVFLLAAAICVYRSARPWTSLPAKILIWVAFGCLIATGIGLPLLRNRIYPAVALIQGLVFLYLLWMHWMTKKLTADTDS